MLVERAEVEVLHLDFQEEREEGQQVHRLVQLEGAEGVHRRSMGLVDRAVRAGTVAVMLPVQPDSSALRHSERVAEAVVRKRLPGRRGLAEVPAVLDIA
jgi:hypothetical protein